MPGWKVWGDRSEAYLVDVDEQTAKQYVKDHPEEKGLYVEDPDGNEYAHVDGRWQEA